MARSFTLKINAATITKSARENSARCMIAQAIKDIGGTYPAVTKEGVAFNMNRVRYTYPLPASAAAELLKFDEGKEVRPFVIHLQAHAGSERPVRYERQVEKRKIDVTKIIKGSKKTNGRRKRRLHRSTRRAAGLRVIEGV